MINRCHLADFEMCNDHNIEMLECLILDNPTNAGYQSHTMATFSAALFMLKLSNNYLENICKLRNGKFNEDEYHKVLQQEQESLREHWRKSEFSSEISKFGVGG